MNRANDDKDQGVQNLLEPESYLRTIIDSVPVGMSYFDTELRYRFVNRASEILLEKKSAEIIGKTLREVVGDEAYKISGKYAKRALKGESVSFENTYSVAGGRSHELRVSYTPIFGSDGQVEGFCSSLEDVTEHVKLEDTLSASEKRLHTLLDAMPFMVSYVDKDQKFRFRNKASRQWAKDPEESPIGQHMRDVIGKSGYDAVREHVDRALSGVLVAYEQEIPNPGDINRHVHGIYVPDISQSGQAQGFHSIVQDITDRKIAEATLRENEERYRLFINNVEEGVIVFEDGIINEVSDVWANMFHCDTDFPIGKSPLDFTAPEMRARAAEKIGAGDTQPYESILLRKDGTTFPGIVRGRQLEIDGTTVRLTTILDITDRKAAEASLRENEERFRLFINNVEEGVFVSKDGLAIDVSDVWLTMFGYEREEVIGSRHLDFVPKEFHSVVKANMSDKSFAPYEIDLQKKDGTIFPAFIRAKNLLLDGKLVRFATIQDISLQKKNEAALIEAKNEADQANRAKSEFLSSMSHELRTPMNAILGFAQLLDFNPNEPLSENQKSSVASILKGGSHLLELIDQVLELNKIETGRLSLNIESVSVRDIVNESLNLIKTRAEQEGIGISDQTADDHLPRLWTDGTRLTQVLLNLLSNAVKYNHPGGTVTLSCEQIGESYLRFIVVDTGRGIPIEKQDNLFVPFERLGLESGDIEGTGIGLTITRQIVELLGGRIGFESEVGKGSSFWFDIPTENKNLHDLAALPTSPDSLTSANQENDNRPARTILYVEDNPDNLRLMETLIGRIENAGLLTAYNAEQGLDMARTEKPNLILMDINLPGVNGLDALKKLQNMSETQDIPVVAITAAAMQREVQAGLKAGFQDYVTKPINVANFTSMLKRLLYPQ